MARINRERTEGGAKPQGGDAAAVALAGHFAEVAAKNPDSAKESVEAAKAGVKALDELAGLTELSQGEMVFSAFEFRNGVNLTVRRGIKWVAARGLYTAVDRPREAAESGMGREGRMIRILDTLAARFWELHEGNIYHGLLHFEHDPLCRNYSSLLRTMRRVYAPETPTSVGGFTPADAVTLVFFITEDHDGLVGRV